MYSFEFKEQSASDSQFDTSESTEKLKQRCGRLAQEMVDCASENRLQDLPQNETGAVVRELRSRGVAVEITSPNKEDAIITFTE